MKTISFEHQHFKLFPQKACVNFTELVVFSPEHQNCKILIFKLLKLCLNLRNNKVIVVPIEICEGFENTLFSFLKSECGFNFKSASKTTLSLHNRFIKRQPVRYDSESALAYAAYYGLVNNLKLWALIQSFREFELKGPILDFGSGPIGILLVAKEVGVTEISYFEPSLHNRRLLKNFAAFLGIKTENFSVSAKFNTILALNSLREVSNPKKAIKWLSKNLSDQGKLIIIEPGDKDSSTRLVRLKSQCGNLEVSFPCPHNKTCPMLGTKDWCHCVIELQRGRYLRELDRKLKLNHHRIKLSCLIFSKEKNLRENVLVSIKGSSATICSREGLIQVPPIKKRNLWEQIL